MLQPAPVAALRDVETSKAEMLRDSLKSDVESYLMENRTLQAMKEKLEREVEKLKSTTAAPGGG